MIIHLFIICFFVLLLIPFIPSIIELLRPKDASPLFINMDYSKDPRYFSKSFKKIIKNEIPDNIGPGIKEVTLSKKEKVEIAHSKRILIGEEVNHILYIIGDLVSEDKVRFDKEVYVKGSALIGRKSTVRAIACEESLSISEGVSIIRWADAEGKIVICDGCNLGISISSGDELKIGRGCKFKRLYGTPITTYSENNNNQGCYPGKEEISNNTRIIDKNRMIIQPFSKIEKDIILKKDLRVGRCSIVHGNIKTYGDLFLEENAKIFGNIFSEGNIEISENASITGNIFSQKAVTLKKGVRIGSAEKFKSVIGKEKIILHQNITIFGYAMTEGSGLVI